MGWAPDSSTKIGVDNSTGPELFAVGTLLKVLNNTVTDLALRTHSHIEPGPDIRIRFGDGQTADVKIVQDLDGVTRAFYSQFQHTAFDETRNLANVWDMSFAVRLPLESYLTRDQLNQKVEVVLRAAEQRSSEPETMIRYADQRLRSPQNFLTGVDNNYSWQKAVQKGLSFEEWVWEHSGYWHPELLLSHNDHTDTQTLPEPVEVHVVGAPSPTEDSEPGGIRWLPGFFSDSHNWDGFIKRGLYI